MNPLVDSNLEALTFNYLSFGFITVINNIWTWLAVITAAISFWKIRPSDCPKPQQFLPPSNDRLSNGPDPALEVTELDAVSEPASVWIPRVVPVNGGADVDGVTKGKFTVYYEDDVAREREEEWEATDGKPEGCDFSEWWESWERLLKLREGESENGWYTWQDLTAINGNVVRLWDGGFRFGAFTRESRDSCGCARVW